MLMEIILIATVKRLLTYNVFATKKWKWITSLVQSCCNWPVIAQLLSWV